MKTLTIAITLIIFLLTAVNMGLLIALYIFKGKIMFGEFLISLAVFFYVWLVINYINNNE
jgi:hypothetical protein